MAYNNGWENRKWCIWKETKKILRKYGIDEITIKQIPTDDGSDFSSNGRCYHWTSSMRCMTLSKSVFLAIQPPEICKEIEDFILELQQKTTLPQRFNVEELMEQGEV